MDVQKFRELPLLGIVRGVAPGDIEPLVETSVASGLQAIEITMNTEGAAELIRQMSAMAGAELMVGAGTVLNTEQLHQALDAGATFVVMPTLVEPVVEHCREHGIPVFPGALTPGEIHRAWQSGATMVKLFPASCFGPSYVKEIKAPLQDMELLACGGITPENAGSYFAAGASAVAFGGSVFNHTWLKNREFNKIGSRIEAFVQSVREHHPA